MTRQTIKIVYILFLLLILTTNSTFADGLNLSVKGGYLHYEEPSANIDFSGLVSGLQGSFKKTISTYTLKIQSEYMKSQTTYDGHVNVHRVSGESEMTSSVQGDRIRYDSSLWYTDSTLTIGKLFKKTAYRITSYAGIGYRFLDNTENPDVPYDYERTVAYLYIPLVLELQKKISRSQSWGFTGEIDILIHGKVNANISDVTKKCNDLSFNQSIGGGLKLSSYYRKQIFGLHFSVNPFFEMWLMANSDKDTLFYDGHRMLVKSADGDYNDYCEPANITFTAGLQFNLLF